MIGHVGGFPRIVHVDVTLTRFKITGLLKFRKLHSISSAILEWSSKLMVDSTHLVYSVSQPDFRISF